MIFFGVWARSCSMACTVTITQITFAGEFVVRDVSEAACVGPNQGLEETYPPPTPHVTHSFLTHSFSVCETISLLISTIATLFSTIFTHCACHHAVTPVPIHVDTRISQNPTANQTRSLPVTKFPDTVLGTCSCPENSLGYRQGLTLSTLFTHRHPHTHTHTHLHSQR